MKSILKFTAKLLPEDFLAAVKNSETPPTTQFEIQGFIQEATLSLIDRRNRKC